MTTTRRLFLGAALAASATAPLFAAAQTCCGKGASGACAAGAGKLTATGAVVLESNNGKTKIKIVCGKCGHKTAPIEIDTPTADKPYTQEWTCPKCGFKQTVTVAVAKA